MTLLPMALATALLIQGSQDAPATKGEEPDPDQAVIRQQLPSYPLDTCAVSGEELGGEEMGDPIDLVVNGRLVRLCCKGCIKKVKASPAEFIAKVDQAVIKAQKDDYPLETCPVSGEPLGEMGEPIDYVHGTRLVRLCCKGCVKKFDKDPEPFMAKIDAALIKAQRAHYPLETCVVSGESLDSMGEPVDFLYGTRLVRFCCKGCRKEFDKGPGAFLAKLGKHEHRDHEKGDAGREKGHRDHEKGHGGHDHGSHMGDSR